MYWDLNPFTNSTSIAFFSGFCCTYSRLIEQMVLDRFIPIFVCVLLAGSWTAELIKLSNAFRSWYAAIRRCRKQRHGRLSRQILVRHVHAPEIVPHQELQSARREAGVVSIPTTRDAEMCVCVATNLSVCPPHHARGRYPPYSERKTTLLSMLLRKRRGIPGKYFAYAVIFGLGVASSFLISYLAKVCAPISWALFATRRQTQTIVTHPFDSKHTHKRRECLRTSCQFITCTYTHRNTDRWSAWAKQYHMCISVVRSTAA